MAEDRTRTLGLDIGDRWIGVALSDPAGILASPLAVLDRRDAASEVQMIVDIVREREVGTVVVGLPRRMNGSVGPQAEKVKAFVNSLESGLGVPVEFRDERLSTVSARRLMKDAGARRGRQRSRDDAAAAAVILQGYLDEARG